MCVCVCVCVCMCVCVCVIWKLHVPDDGRLASQHKQKIFNISSFPLLFHTVCIL